MSDPATPNPRPNDDTTPEAALGRRRLLRGGLVAAGVGVAAAVANQPGAAADDGDSMLVGVTNVADSSTTLRTQGTVATPGLILEKTNGGPQLRLIPKPITQPLQAIGDISMVSFGPLVGVSDGRGGVSTDYLATGSDLDQLSSLVSVPPFRYLDTRSAAGRQNIIATSSSAFDASYRLKPGAWVDIVVDDGSEELPVELVFVNLTAVAPVTGGYLSAYPPGPRPNVSSVNFAAKQTIANGVMVGAVLNGEVYTIRIYTSALTHVLADVSAVAYLGPSGVTSNRQGTGRAARRSPARRIVRAQVRKPR